MITMIAAITDSFGIGINNHLPWGKNEADLKFFKEETIGGAVIMGRKTFESIGQQPLPNRHNIVVTSTPHKVASFPNLVAIKGIEEAIDFAEKLVPRVYIIGGESIYCFAMKFADRILLSHMNCDPPCDTYFPSMASSEWDGNGLLLEGVHVTEYFRK